MRAFIVRLHFALQMLWGFLMSSGVFALSGAPRVIIQLCLVWALGSVFLWGIRWVLLGGSRPAAYLPPQDPVKLGER